MITRATIISNNVSVKHMPEAGQDAQQTLNITPTHVTLTRYILDQKMVEKGKEEADLNGQAILDLIEQSFHKTSPIIASLEDNSWEIIVKDETGYRWFSGAMGEKISYQNQDVNELMADMLPFKNLILFGYGK